jgi:hypothetical protein
MWKKPDGTEAKKKNVLQKEQIIDSINKEKQHNTPPLFIFSRIKIIQFYGWRVTTVLRTVHLFIL